MKRFLELSDIGAYRISEELSDEIWKIVDNWNFFAKDTTGKQFVRAVDSIFNNIAEGFGRYFKKDKIKFYHYSLGSTGECVSICKKSLSRGLITQEQNESIMGKLNVLPREIRYLIKYF